MMNLPQVSVIVTTYNGAQYLEQQVLSITGQTYRKLEIIICDDHSTDRSAEIIKKICSTDSRVLANYNQKNIGVNKNFEQGFLQASGEFIAIADQDDIWLPEKIEEQMALFTTNDIVLVHSISVRFSGETFPIKKKASSVNLFAGNDVKKLLLRNSVSGHNIIFRKNLLSQILPFPKDVYYDWWIVQTAACTGKVAGTSKVLAYQRSHGSNVTIKERTTPNQTEAEYAERKNALQAFIRLKGLKDNDLKFIEVLRIKFHQLENRSYSPELYRFLMKNREIFFFYKKGLLRYFSQRKAAKRMSRKVKG